MRSSPPSTAASARETIPSRCAETRRLERARVCAPDARPRRRASTGRLALWPGRPAGPQEPDLDSRDRWPSLARRSPRSPSSWSSRAATSSIRKASGGGRARPTRRPTWPGSRSRPTTRCGPTPPRRPSPALPAMQWSAEVEAVAAQWAATACTSTTPGEATWGEHRRELSGLLADHRRVVAGLGLRGGGLRLRVQQLRRGKVCGHYTQLVWRTARCSVAPTRAAPATRPSRGTHLGLLGLRLQPSR
jgi:hypothetical protein